jgi:hypothetical protein
MLQVALNHPGVRRLVMSKAAYTVSPECVCIGTLRDGLPAGGFVIGAYYPGCSVEAHMGGHPHWMNRDVVVMFFDYVFNQLGVKKLIAPVPSTNTRALEIDLRAGFQIEARIKDAVPDGDLLILTMLRAECRFLGLPLRGFTRGSKVEI